MRKDLHETPFKESTIAKLEIFEDYAQTWLPTFIMQRRHTISIFDFFAGTGYDQDGVPGSPVRILRKLQEQRGNLFANNVTVEVHLNEFEPNKKAQQKFEKLKQACEDFMEENKGLTERVNIFYYNENFELLFKRLVNRIKSTPSLVYLDQNGIKFLTKSYLLEFEKAKETDFLYFISSSYFWRFGGKQEFKKHLDIDVNKAKESEYKHIHRYLTDQLRKELPKNSKLKLYPFSLKKGANIHGIIFGASHPRAVAKFLDIAWKRNSVNGDANFDIDEDTEKAQMNLFGERRLTKKESFKQEIRNLILEQKITNNFDLFDYTLSKGHIGTHAAECLRQMKKEGEIHYDSKTPMVTYEKVHKDKVKVNYKVLQSNKRQ